VLKLQQNRDHTKRNKDEGNKLKRNILIIGDGHTRGLAMNLRQNLNEDHKVQGLVKLGSNLTAILNPNIQDMKGFTKNDIIIVLHHNIQSLKNKLQWLALYLRVN
jgi:hypothetical protein